MASVRDRAVTIRELQKAGLPVVRGRAYVRKEWVPKRRLTLETLHRKMGMFRGSLAEEIARARDEG